MRVVKCTAAAATVLLSTARHVEATERTPGVVSDGGGASGNSGGFDAAYQQPLMQAGPGEEQGDGLLRSILDIIQLDLERTDADADADVQSQDFQACAACETLLAGLKVAAAGGDALFISTATSLCKRLKVQDDDVCEGSIAREGPIAARALRAMTLGSRTSRLLCVATMGFCSYPEVDADELSFPSPKPPLGRGPLERPPPSGRKPLRIVHYSDIHVDPWYVAGANANCTKPICCRDYSATDPASEHDVPAGPNGDHKCDVPASLEESMYAAIRDLVPDAAFSIFTGDIVDHAIWNTTVSQNTLDIHGAYNRMSDAGMFVYGTAGNHESSPTNSYPPTNGTLGGGGEGLNSQWLYDLLSSSWSSWIEPEAAKTARNFGAYSVKYVHEDEEAASGTLRIISLNTNLFYRHNLWLYEEPMLRDPSGQLVWLIAELDAAERAGERVYIIGHMPLGSADAFHEASNYLDQIVNRYEATIAALFFGHTHRDEFQLSYSDYQNRNHTNAVAMSYIASSLTPTSGHPSFRVYDVDPVTFGVLDVTTYAANMSEPDFHTRGPQWRKYYSAKETYGPLVADLGPASTAMLPFHSPTDENWELTPAFWHNVTEALEHDAAAFEDYVARKSRGWGGAGGGCYHRHGDDGVGHNGEAGEKEKEAEKECVRVEICRLRGARSQDNCQLPSSKIGFGRSRAGATIAGVPAEEWVRGYGSSDGEGGERGMVQEEECESSVMRDTFSALGSVARALAVAR